MMHGDAPCQHFSGEFCDLCFGKCEFCKTHHLRHVMCDPFIIEKYHDNVFVFPECKL